MTKVYPNYPATIQSPESSNPFNGEQKEEAVMTVWRKSLLFNSNGFTVYDAKGNLVFRVDNYASASNGVIVLMNASGKCLMTIIRKRLSLGEKWLICHGEETVKSRFSVMKHVTLIPSKVLAHVATGGRESRLSYSIEGSYSGRRCTIFNSLRDPVAEVRNKEVASGVTLGGDVFQLVVLPGFDTSVAMALVIVLEQMFG